MNEAKKKRSKKRRATAGELFRKGASFALDMMARELEQLRAATSSEMETPLSPSDVEDMIATCRTAIAVSCQMEEAMK